MRYIIYGAGAVGGTIGWRLHEADHEVVLIARGAHLEAMDANGLRLQRPDSDGTRRVPLARSPAEVEPTDGDVVILTTKTQDTIPALEALVDVASPDLPIVCAQNGIENERLASRWFRNVHGVCVVLPALIPEPGVVQSFGMPSAAILDLGRYPQGVDDTSRQVAEAFQSAGFASNPDAAIMRWKHRKLIHNLTGALEALCGPEARRSDVGRAVQAEGVRTLEAAGFELASEQEDADRRGGTLKAQPIDDDTRPHTSTWQSVARGAGTIESDYLNGEIVRIGRRYGLPTPINEVIQSEARKLARAGGAVASVPLATLEAMVGDLGHP